MLRFAVKKLPFVIRYVPDQSKVQEMCDKSNLQNNGTLMSVPDCFKNKMCNQAVANYVHALEFVPHCYKTEEMCNYAVNTSPSAI